MNDSSPEQNTHQSTDQSTDNQANQEPQTSITEDGSKIVLQSPEKIAKLRKTALIGYFGLLILMPLWLLVFNPTPELDTRISLVMFWLPLFLPMAGLLKGKPYTYAWTNFVVMLNFMHGATSLWVVPNEIFFAILEMLFSSMLFFAGTYYARYQGQREGLKLPKLKDLP